MESESELELKIGIEIKDCRYIHLYSSKIIYILYIYTTIYYISIHLYIDILYIYTFIHLYTI